MKKVMVIGLVVLAVVLGVAPNYIGSSIEEEVNAKVEHLNTMPGYRATVSEYKKGWFSSNAVVNIAYDVSFFGIDSQHPVAAYKDYVDEVEAIDEAELVDAEGGDESHSVDAAPVGLNEDMLAAMEAGLSFDLDIQHGLVILERSPGLALSDIYITLNDSISEELQEFLSMINESYTIDDLLVTTIRTSLLGDSRYKTTIPVISIDDEDVKFNYSGLNLSGSSSGSNNTYDVAGNLGAVNVSSQEADFTMSEIAVEGEWTWLGASWLSVGSSVVSIDEMSFKASPDVVDASEMVDFTLQGLQFSSDVSSSGEDMLAMILDADIKQIVVQDYVVSDIDYDFELKNLRESAFIAFYEELETFNGVAQPTEEDIARLTALAGDFASAGPEIHINKLGYKLSEANFLDFSGQLVLDPVLAEEAINTGNMFALIPALSSELKVEMGEELLALVQTQALQQQLAAVELDPAQKAEIMAQQQAQLPMMTQQFIEQGMIEKIAHGFRVNAEFKNGELLVNGNPIPLF